MINILRRINLMYYIDGHGIDKILKKVDGVIGASSRVMVLLSCP
jgi:hypothetical protein